MALADTRSSHRWREPPGNFDTLNTRAIYPGDNRWGIPDLPAATHEPSRMVAYNDRHGCQTAPEGAAVHFFLDDYRFETLWTKPQRPLSRLKAVGAALTPDFSLWRDMPPAMQVWQTYRARWCGMWMLQHGIQVIPTVSWSTEDSWAYCFAGIPRQSVVAVSTVGTHASDARPLFNAGYTAMCATLNPTLVLVYGTAVADEVAGLAPWRRYATRWNDAKRTPARLGE